MNVVLDRESPPPFSPQWEEVLDEVRDLDKYQPDWDDEGADAVPLALIRMTCSWLRTLQAQGTPAPASVYPLADGTVMVEWHYEHGAADSANIRSGGRIEIVRREQGAKPTFTVLSIPGLIESEHSGEVSLVPRLIRDAAETSPECSLPGVSDESNYSLAA